MPGLLKFLLVLWGTIGVICGIEFAVEALRIDPVLTGILLPVGLLLWFATLIGGRTILIRVLRQRQPE